MSLITALPRPNRGGRGPAGFVVAAGILLLGGCQSGPAPDQMSRTEVKTAPADLQLLCANAIATATGAPSDKILPVSSRQLDSKTYQVELDASGRKSSCIVGDDGVVKSVQPA